MNPYLIGGDALGAVFRFRRRGSPELSTGSTGSTGSKKTLNKKVSTKQPVPKSVKASQPVPKSVKASTAKKLVSAGDRATAVEKKLAKRDQKTSAKFHKLANSVYHKATTIAGEALGFGMLPPVATGAPRAPGAPAPAPSPGVPGAVDDSGSGGSSGGLTYHGTVLDPQTIMNLGSQADAAVYASSAGDIIAAVYKDLDALHQKTTSANNLIAQNTDDQGNTDQPDLVRQQQGLLTTYQKLSDDGHALISRADSLIDVVNTWLNDTTGNVSPPDMNGLSTSLQTLQGDFQTWGAKVNGATPPSVTTDQGSGGPPVMNQNIKNAAKNMPVQQTTPDSGAGSNQQSNTTNTTTTNTTPGSPSNQPSNQNQPPSQQPPPWWSAPPPPNWTYGGGYGGYGGGYGGGGYGGGGYDDGGGGLSPVDESNIDWGDGSTSSPPPSPDYVDQGVDWGTAASADDGGDESADFVNQGIPDDMMGAEEKPIPWYAWAAVAVVGVIGLVGFTKTWRAS